MTALLWWLRDAAGHDLDALAATLPRDEQAALAGMARQERRRGFILSRVLLRRLITATTGSAHDDIRFARDDSGRLWLEQPAGWHISLSHARERVAVMLAARPCGVDIEVPHAVAFQRLADRYFSPAESTWLATCTDAEKPAAFFRLWTLKEAGVKALGVGLAHHLASLAFDVSAETPRQLEGEPLQLWQQRQPDGCLAAAVHGQEAVTWSVREIPLATLLTPR